MVWISNTVRVMPALLVQGLEFWPGFAFCETITCVIPGQALRVTEGGGIRISRQSTYECDKVVSHTHRPHLQKNSFVCFLYGCENRSLTLREEHRLRVFENRVLRQIFGPQRDEVTMEWRKLHNEGFNGLYCSSNIVRMTKWRIR
jgi:hypothetical protein